MPANTWTSRIIGRKNTNAKHADKAFIHGQKPSSTCINRIIGGPTVASHAIRVLKARAICDRYACVTSEASLVMAKYLQHLQSSIYRGTDIACPFCKRGFAAATGVTHHLEIGSCPKARSLNRETILTEVRRRDPNHIITKKLLTYHTESSITATSASWNPRIGMYECYLCHKGFRELKSLNSHVNSPAHKEHVYHCPGRTCGREFRALAALFNHLESETCGAVRFDAVQRNVGDILSGQRRIGFN
jgi:phage FluMu protein Com